MRRVLINIVLAFTLLALAAVPAFAAPDPSIGINVVLTGDVTKEALAELGKFGKVQDVIYAIDALTMKIKSSQLPAALDFVCGQPRCRAHRRPIDTVLLRISPMVQAMVPDVINVTNPGAGRTVDFTPGATWPCDTAWWTFGGSLP